jgi:hypothetical protein
LDHLFSAATSQNADNYRLALVRVDLEDPSHDRLRYLRNPFGEEKVSALVNGVQFKWHEMWDRGAARS